MTDQPEVIREQMEETKSQLTQKLEALEEHVSDTVQATTAMVSNTVEAVKETVENATSAVKDSVHSLGSMVDFQGHIERHPWMAFGGSVALGFLAAQLLGRGPRRSRRNSGQKSWLGEQFDRLQGLALSSVLGMVRDKLGTALPGQLGERVAQEVDHLTSRLGGEPIQGPVINGAEQHSPASQESNHRERATA